MSKSTTTKPDPASMARAFTFTAPAPGPGRMELSFKSITIRELLNLDNDTIAVWAQANISPALKDSPLAQITAEQREAIRLSITAVDGNPVNEHGEPFMDMDEWTYRSQRFVMAAFNRVNGVAEDEISGFLDGAVPSAPDGANTVRIDRRAAASGGDTSE